MAGYNLKLVLQELVLFLACAQVPRLTVCVTYASTGFHNMSKYREPWAPERTYGAKFGSGNLLQN